MIAASRDSSALVNAFWIPPCETVGAHIGDTGRQGREQRAILIEERLVRSAST